MQREARRRHERSGAGRAPRLAVRSERACALAAALLLALMLGAPGCRDGDRAEVEGGPSTGASRTPDAAPAPPHVGAGPIVRVAFGVALHGDSGRFEVARIRRSGRAPLRFTLGRGEGEWPIAGDWDGDGFDTLGVFRPDTSAFHLRDSLDAGLEDRRVAFGDPRWAGVPVVGDWDGDGVDTAGVWVRADSSFHLTNARTTSPPDHQFTFGPPRSDWIPIAGDWDGDGRDGVGVYDPGAGVFHLKNTLAPAAAEAIFEFGPKASGVLPVVGDWDGRGRDRVGFFDPASSEFKLRYELAPGSADETFRIETELVGARPLAGRWLPAED